MIGTARTISFASITRSVSSNAACPCVPSVDAVISTYILIDKPRIEMRQPPDPFEDLDGKGILHQMRNSPDQTMVGRISSRTARYGKHFLLHERKDTASARAASGKYLSFDSPFEKVF